MSEQDLLHLRCSQCRAGVRVSGPEQARLRGWSVAMLSLAPLDLSLVNAGTALTTTDYLCPTCSKEAGASMKKMGDGDGIEQA